MLDFERTDLTGEWHIKDIVLEHNGVFYELAAKTPLSLWNKQKILVEASFATLEAPNR